MSSLNKAVSWAGVHADREVVVSIDVVGDAALGGEEAVGSEVVARLGEIRARLRGGTIVASRGVGDGLRPHV